MVRDLNISKALSASDGKIGGGIIDLPDFKRSAQSGHAVDQFNAHLFYRNDIQHLLAP
jgi:hypothetical protein